MEMNKVQKHEQDYNVETKIRFLGQKLIIADWNLSLLTQNDGKEIKMQIRGG